MTKFLKALLVLSGLTVLPSSSRADHPDANHPFERCHIYEHANRRGRGSGTRHHRRID